MNDDSKLIVSKLRDTCSELDSAWGSIVSLYVKKVDKTHEIEKFTAKLVDIQSSIEIMEKNHVFFIESFKDTKNEFLKKDLLAMHLEQQKEIDSLKDELKEQSTHLEIEQKEFRSLLARMDGLDNQIIYLNVCRNKLLGELK